MSLMRGITLFITFLFGAGCWSSDALPINSFDGASVAHLEDHFKYSLNYLEQQVLSEKSEALAFGLLSTLFSAVSFVPGLVTCIASDFGACISVAIPCGVFGLVLAIPSGIYTGFLFGYVRNQQIVAKLIREAFEVTSSLEGQNTIASYLANYKARHITDAHTVQQLAEKIQIATELGYFVPTEALRLDDDRLSPYKHYEDAPSAQKFFCYVGKFFGRKPQVIVDKLIETTFAILNQEKEDLRSEVIKWNKIVEDFITKAKEQEERRVGGTVEV